MHELRIIEDPTCSLHVIEGLREASLREKKLLLDRLSSILVEMILDFIGRTKLLELMRPIGRKIGLQSRSIYARMFLKSFKFDVLNIMFKTSVSFDNWIVHEDHIYIFLK